MHIKLPNILPEIFQIILRYIYCGKLSLKEYDISDIIKILVAGKLLVSVIQSENLQMNVTQIWEHVLKWGLAQNPELPSDPTNFSKEDFKALKNNIRQFIPFIKFRDLTTQEFSDKVLPYRKILPKELLYDDLLKYFLNPDSQPIKNSKLYTTTKEINIDFKIITIQHIELISKWIDRLDDIKNAYKFNLLLRGSRDAFASKKFHEICDNRSHTITIIKVKDNNEILGGYNPIAWESGDAFHVKNEYLATFNHSNFCPSFGTGDLSLIKTSGGCINNDYEKKIRETTDEFTVEEYEVFQIKKINYI
ncbi:carbohydrate-binding module family 13 protein [Rhizophagus clarus]|uniref:Carbohydrate-binding module family 13 protein n=1 Tax=Rhizophagus clarus TaxID=94130 RepID=A0A8H3M7E6_9GLOM|nr:carbohydrate-binding module family 13 protein [Rhizophagus clarus]